MRTRKYSVRGFKQALSVTVRLDTTTARKSVTTPVRCLRLMDFSSLGRNATSYCQANPFLLLCTRSAMKDFEAGSDFLFISQKSADMVTMSSYPPDPKTIKRKALLLIKARSEVEADGGGDEDEEASEAFPTGIHNEVVFMEVTGKILSNLYSSCQVSFLTRSRCRLASLTSDLFLKYWPRISSISRFEIFLNFGLSALILAVCSISGNFDKLRQNERLWTLFEF